MKRALTLLGLGALTLSACGVDPVSERIGIHSASLVNSSMCTKLEGNATHANQQFDLNTAKTARISVQPGLPLTVNLNCTYDVTTIVDDKPVITQKTEPLTATQIVGRSADLYVTVLRTPNVTREIKVSEAYHSSPVILNATADASACTEFSATIAPSYSNAPIVLTKTRTTDLGYYAQGDTVTVKATCTAGEQSVTYTRDFPLATTLTVHVASSTDEEGKPALTSTVN